MTLRPWLELARLSNAPTIVSNVLVGWAMGMRGADEASWGGAAPAILAVLLLYVGGMAFNDVMDVEIDRVERPGRPIPSGRIARHSAAIFVMACFTIALAVLAAQGALALAYGFVLMIVSVIYNVIHAHHAWSAVLMGLCRGLVYMTAALAAGGRPAWSALGLLVAGLGLYTLLFSIVARGESGGRRPRFAEIIILAPMFAILPAEFVASSAPAWMTILGRSAFLLWTLSVAVFASSPRRDLGRAVGWWIAGIALLDLYHLTRLNEPAAALVAAACFVLTLAGQRWIAGS